MTTYRWNIQLIFHSIIFCTVNWDILLAEKYVLRYLNGIVFCSPPRTFFLSLLDIQISNSQITPKPNIQDANIILCIWWDKKGALYSELLKLGETNNDRDYRQQLIKVKQAMVEKCSEYAIRHEAIIFQHRNARPSVAGAVIVYYSGLNLIFSKTSQPFLNSQKLLKSNLQTRSTYISLKLQLTKKSHTHNWVFFFLSENIYLDFPQFFQFYRDLQRFLSFCLLDFVYRFKCQNGKCLQITNGKQQFTVKHAIKYFELFFSKILLFFLYSDCEQKYLWLLIIILSCRHGKRLQTGAGRNRQRTKTKQSVWVCRQNGNIYNIIYIYIFIYTTEYI